MEFVIEHLKKRFDEKEVLKDISFTFEEGKIYGLLGKNGSGKTTLFNCINEDLTADGGSAFFQEEMQTGERKKRNAAAEDIGYVLSTPTVPEFLTAREFIRFFTEINAESIPDKKTPDEWLEFVHIEKEDRDRLLKDYSHGMKNKIQMLANVIVCPGLLLLDEPLTSLDVLAAEEMKEVLRSLKKGRVIILSTHIMDLALDLCDEIVLLHHGILEKVEEKNMGAEDLRNRILESLREERDA